MRVGSRTCVYLYSVRVTMLVPDITDAFENIFKVMLVTNCVHFFCNVNLRVS